MLRIMKADMYRLVRGKAMYLTFAVFMLIILGVIYSNVSRGIETTGDQAPFSAMAINSEFLPYILLSMIILVAAADFSSQTIKNALASGVSRIKYYFAKLLLSFGFCILILLLNILVTMIIVTLLNGFSGEFNIDYVVSILKPLAMHTLLYFAITSVGVALTFITQKSAAVIGIYAAWLILLQTIFIQFIISISSELSFLEKYDIMFNITSFTSFSEQSLTDVTRGISISLVYIGVSTLVALSVFRKSEIK